MARSIVRFGCTLVLAGASCAWGQSVISAQSGMIHYVEGKVLLEGQEVQPKFGDFPSVKNDQVLETAEGRAEVLMTPGVFLRLAENSSFKMLSNRLSDTAIEILSGSAIVEVDELMKDNAITVRYKDATIALSKQGLYRVDADTAKLRVYDGEANVTYGLKTIAARRGKQVELNETLLASTFDVKDTDAFYRWVARRSEYIAAANVSSARAAGNNGYGGYGYGSGACAPTTYPNGGAYPSSMATGTAATPYCDPYGSGYGAPYGYSPYGMWAWNPYYGMFTYLPGMGYGYSPFGWALYSPMTVGALYIPGAYGGSPSSVLSNRGSGPTTLSGANATHSAASASALRANGPTAGGSSLGSSSGSGVRSSGGSSGGGVSGGARASGGGGHR